MNKKLNVQNFLKKSFFLYKLLKQKEHFPELISESNDENYRTKPHCAKYERS